MDINNNWNKKENISSKLKCWKYYYLTCSVLNKYNDLELTDQSGNS